MSSCLDMLGQTIDKDDIVQIAPGSDLPYAGALVVVTEPKHWGIQGYLCLPFAHEGLCRFKGLAYVRVKSSDCLMVGHCAWVLEPEEGEDDASTVIEALEVAPEADPTGDATDQAPLGS